MLINYKWMINYLYVDLHIQYNQLPRNRYVT